MCQAMVFPERQRRFQQPCQYGELGDTRLDLGEPRASPTLFARRCRRTRLIPKKPNRTGDNTNGGAMNPSLDIHPTQRPASQAASAGRTPLRIASDELLRGERRLIIDHGESSYTLLLTRNGKLILTK